MELSDIHSLIEVGVTHNPEIKKKVIIPKGKIDSLKTFSLATFKPGQSSDTHKHKDMFEIFYVLSGRIAFIVENKKTIVSKDNCILIEPGELHSQINESDEDSLLLYFGIYTKWLIKMYFSYF